MLVLLGEISQDLAELRGERSDTQKELYALKERMAVLSGEVKNRTDVLVQKMKVASGESGDIRLDDLDEALRQAFNRADSNKTEHFNLWQFSRHQGVMVGMAQKDAYVG